ncbi:SRPBCC family protein [Mangrovimonas cancribranchiae]|uniref:SRPBCC domain-containing protein n=1 Tax=Mangrovimonas cancribranchiae TaxID=3080055 RepID=A0AAU6PAE5_9FLAO
MKTTQPNVIVIQTFHLPKAVVWKAITNHNHMVEWFFHNIPDFKAEVGFKTAFNVKAPSRDFMHLWEIKEVLPEEKIVYNWKYKGFEGDSFVIFKLKEADGNSQLTVTTKVVKDFDDTIPEFKRESCEQGWNYFIKDSLVSYLEENYNS